MPEAPSEGRPPEDIRERRTEILRLAFRRGDNVRLFGSTLHGNIGPDSDVDFLVDLDPDRNLLDLGGLQMDLQELLGRPVDLKSEEFLRRDIRERVLEEAVPL